MPRTGVLGQATRIDPVPADRDALDGLKSRGDVPGDELVLKGADGSEITLPDSLVRLVRAAADRLAAGQAVVAIPAEVTLTPAEVAELLGLSRPFVGKLLDRGTIPSELLPESSHRRVRLADVLAFQARRERRAEGTRRLVDIADAAGLPYLELVMARVFVDTNVLFPISLMDMMFSLNDDAVHEVLWTDHLLDEWERVIIREQRRSPDAAAAMAATVREFLSDGRIPVEAYQHLVPEADGPDPDDCVHIAAAVGGRAEVIVTWNLPDFESSYLKAHAVTVTDPDSYLCALFEDAPDEVIATVRRMAARKRRPPMSPTDILDRLDKAGVHEFASRVRTRLVGHAD